MRRQTNPLPQLILPRAQGALARLGGMLWAGQSPLSLSISPIQSERLPLDQARRLAYRPLAEGHIVGPPFGAWTTRWLKLRVPGAKAAERGRRHLIFECQGEATVYHQGRPWAGLDPAHRSCPLPDGAADLFMELGLWQTGIWIPGARGIDAQGPRFDKAAIGLRNAEAWELHWDLDGLVQALKVYYEQSNRAFQTWPHDQRPALESAPVLLRRVLSSLELACDALDEDGPAAMRAPLKAAYRLFPAEIWQPALSLAGHAHIDLVWLWPESVTQSKGAHTFATQLRLMERYPEFRFTQSQPALYRALAKREPKLTAEVAKRIKQGRWEALGAFEVEPDNNLPCGEALVRSLVLGQAELKRLRHGKANRVCWLPDVFGYSAALPQLLKLAGVDRFFTTKMTWSQVTRFPFTSFVWRGHDGSEVLAHLGAGYNGSAEAWRMRDAAQEQRQVDVHPEFLMPTGWGDGGGGVSEEILERARRLKSLAGLPKARWTSVDAFFDRLQTARPKLPVYQGELYLEYHRGTYTTQSDFKAANRSLERALQAHEAVRASLGGSALPTKSWERLAFAAFHDALPGSSIAKVYEELGGELKARAAASLQAAGAELKKAAGAGKALLAFNPLPLPRRCLVDLPSGPRLLDLPPVGAIDTGLAREASFEPVSASLRRLDNGLLRADFDAWGRITALHTAEGSLGLSAPAGFMLHPDQPHAFDAWEIDQAALKLGKAVGPLKGLRLVEHDARRARLSGRCGLGAKSSLRVDYILEAGSPWLKVEVEVDWKEQHQLLKFHAPTGHRGTHALYGAPFGSVRRPQLPGTDREEAQWEVPASRWGVVMGQDDQGLALLSEAKYGYSCKDGLLGLSLLRGSTDPDPQADQGRHRLRFALGRHREACAGALLSTPASADALYGPVFLVPGKALPGALFELASADTLVPSWALPASTGKGWVLRLHETAGRAGRAELHWKRALRSAVKVDLLEKTMGRLKAGPSGSIPLEYKPYEVLSVLIR